LWVLSPLDSWRLTRSYASPRGTHLRYDCMDNIETALKDRGTILAEERTELALQRTQKRLGLAARSWLHSKNEKRRGV